MRTHKGYFLFSVEGGRSAVEASSNPPSYPTQSVNGAGGSKPAHASMSEPQLAGGMAPSASKIGEISETLVAAQTGNFFTVVLNAAVSSMMHVEYWATVPMQEESIALRQSARTAMAPFM